jgi:hypothetical protein
VVMLSGVLERVELEDLQKTEITSIESHYYYHLYMLHYLESECSPEDLEVFSEKVKALKVIFQH